MRMHISYAYVLFHIYSVRSFPANTTESIIPYSYCIYILYFPYFGDVLDFSEEQVDPSLNTIIFKIIKTVKF